MPLDLSNLNAEWNELPGPNGRAHDRLKPIPWGALGSLPRREPLIKRVIECTALSVIYGESNCGKSFFALDLAAHIARGVPWRDRRTKQCPVVYLAAEGGLGIKERLTAYQHHHSIDPADVPFYVIPASADLRTDPTDAMAIIEHIEALGIEPGLIVDDTLAATFGGGNENASDDMGLFLANMQLLREVTGAHVQIIHHCGKEAARGARGHSSLRAATDTEIEIVADQKGNRTATVTKQRDGATGDQFHFRLDEVDIGQDEDGDSITSCVVVSADHGPGRQQKPTGKLLTAKLQSGLDVLQECLEEQGQPAPDSNHYPPGVQVANLDAWRDMMLRRGVLSEGKPTARQQWKRIHDGLSDRELIAEWNSLVWIVSRDGT